MARLDSVVDRMIKQRRASGCDRPDLLSSLMLAQDLENGSEKLNDRQLRDEAMTIFLAGHETSANALAWSWYLLAQHPAVEEQFHHEVDRVLQGRAPSADDVPALEFTARVFAEALRLYPPVWAIGRRAIQECRIGDTIIAPGSVVILSSYVTHRDARWFRDPERFDPERWTPEARSTRPRFSYFPFSAGSRACLGEGFAGLEGVLCLATIAQKWKLRLVPGQTVVPQPQLTLRARNGIRMQVEPRV
jgi:cytochrome P450